LIVVVISLERAVPTFPPTRLGSLPVCEALSGIFEEPPKYPGFPHMLPLGALWRRGGPGIVYRVEKGSAPVTLQRVISTLLLIRRLVALAARSTPHALAARRASGFRGWISWRFEAKKIAVSLLHFVK
jgi:hypothetical protein